MAWWFETDNLIVDSRPQEKRDLLLQPLSTASQSEGSLEVQEGQDPVQQQVGYAHPLKPLNMRGNGHHPVKLFLLQQEVETSGHPPVLGSSQLHVHRVPRVIQSFFITNNFPYMGPSINYVTLKGERGGPVKRYHADFLLSKSIKILTQSVRWEGGEVKMANFGVT